MPVAVVIHLTLPSRVPRLRSLLREKHVSEPNEKLDDLQKKLDEARGHEKPKQGLSPASDSLGSAMRMGVELIAGCAVGLTLGYYADKWLNSSPLCLIVGLFLGVAAGFRNIMRTGMDISDDH